LVIIHSTFCQLVVGAYGRPYFLNQNTLANLTTKSKCVIPLEVNAFTFSFNIYTKAGVYE